MPNIAPDTLERLVRDIFAGWGAPPDDAAWVATMLVRANLRGHDSHGVIRVPHYVRSLKAGDTNPKPQIRIEYETPAIARLDGGLGFGQVVARRGMAIAIDKAKAQGLSAVTLRRTNHVGRLADYTEMAAAQGLIGMAWVNAPMALNVAPWGGAARRLGTNPHAVAVPGPNGTVAMSLDFATSVWAEGKLKVKFARGESVPPGIMLNALGEPSTDPREYYGDPVGSLLTMGQHKGYGLSLAIEIIAGILSGTGAARPERGAVQNGTLFMCLDVQRFVPVDDFHAEVARLFEFTRSAPLAAGAKEILVPGEPEARTSDERRARGVPVEDETWRQLQECAAEIGVAAPAVS
ncbi:MAG: Ldh family oxidoreductase [Candidatus Rokubacteria bacterium]|nr:Ldh family oxidoreductase [Candidatus Rokubacteria bacterium]